MRAKWVNPRSACMFWARMVWSCAAVREIEVDAPVSILVLETVRRSA